MFTANELLEVAEVVAILTARYREQADRYEKQQAEHRAGFGARTEADAKIIAGLRADIDSLKREELATNETLKPLVDRVVKERDGLLTQVHDMRAEKQRLSAQLDWERAEIKRLQWENVTMHKDAEDGYAAAIKVLGDPVALSKERDALRAEVAALKSQNPKQHPVKVGEWVRRLVPSPACDVGTVAKVVHVDDDTSEIEYDVERIDGQHGVWFAKNCEPCDPPNHDTEAGKAAAESAVKTEPVADEIKVGDVVEVVSNTGRNTWLTDVGSVGTVTSIETLEDSLSVRLKAVPDKKNVCGGYVSICDVRKVTT